MEEEDNISTAGFSRRNSLMKLPVKMSKGWWNCIEGIQIPKLKQPSEKEAHSVKFSDTNQSIPSPKNSIFQEGMLYRWNIGNILNLQKCTDSNEGTLNEEKSSDDLFFSQQRQKSKSELTQLRRGQSNPKEGVLGPTLGSPLKRLNQGSQMSTLWEKHNEGGNPYQSDFSGSC